MSVKYLRPLTFHIGIVASRWNDLITELLLKRAEEACTGHPIHQITIDTYRVPGAFEIPVVAKTLCASGRFDGLVALGAILKGETSHFDHLASEVTSSLNRIAVDSGIPIGFGVIAAETMEQALNRAGGKVGNKGEEAASAVIETLTVLDNVKPNGNK